MKTLFFSPLINERLLKKLCIVTIFILKAGRHDVASHKRSVFGVTYTCHFQFHGCKTTHQSNFIWTYINTLGAKVKKLSQTDELPFYWNNSGNIPKGPLAQASRLWPSNRESPVCDCQPRRPQTHRAIRPPARPPRRPSGRERRGPDSHRQQEGRPHQDHRPPQNGRPLGAKPDGHPISGDHDLGCVPQS
jgi:hypothetical protein